MPKGSFCCSPFPANEQCVESKQGQVYSTMFLYIGFVGQCGIHLDTLRLYWLATILIKENNFFSLQGALLESLWILLQAVNLVLDERVTDVQHLFSLQLFLTAHSGMLGRKERRHSRSEKLEGERWGRWKRGEWRWEEC